MAPKGSHDRQPRTLLKTEPRAPPADVAERLRDLERRLAMDSRTEAERWLGDPPRDRSALCRSKTIR
jgi:hypothetical protein